MIIKGQFGVILNTDNVDALFKTDTSIDVILQGKTYSIYYNKDSKEVKKKFDELFEAFARDSWATFDLTGESNDYIRGE